MIELSTIEYQIGHKSYWDNFLAHVHHIAHVHHTRIPGKIYNYAKLIDNELHKYNGVLVCKSSYELKVIKFERDEDATLFLLKFA